MHLHLRASFDLPLVSARPPAPKCAQPEPVVYGNMHRRKTMLNQLLRPYSVLAEDARIESIIRRVYLEWIDIVSVMNGVRASINIYAFLGVDSMQLPRQPITKNLEL